MKEKLNQAIAYLRSRGKYVADFGGKFVPTPAIETDIRETFNDYKEKQKMSKQEASHKTYLADGVYASLEDGRVVLYLDRQVFAALNDYVAQSTGGQNGSV